MSRDFGGRVSTEMEFDFDARGETFVTTDKVRGVILAHLNKREVEPAARLIATSAAAAQLCKLRCTHIHTHTSGFIQS